MARDRRWIVLAEDGRHVTLGRGSDPDQAELASLTETMRAQGLRGWLAVMEGDYHARRAAPTVMLVRALTPVTVEWDAAVAAFQDRHIKSLSAA
ncbi:hypothetical protein [Pseudoroseomonas ludipueritiae]|uniref:Uncharacterized protein n=1 Tax=Pseudoroseomonas ludipueritiae TaxID=198093 RepID=A0ABR7R2Z4_9PROT|nr:hypothetical protein [Pseudoroseomonas ludipueritiae]MBC9176124.1 hypothetical protein [Pseudoroseomonas ludipueritiae]